MGIIVILAGFAAAREMEREGGMLFRRRDGTGKVVFCRGLGTGTMGKLVGNGVNLAGENFFFFILGSLSGEEKFRHELNDSENGQRNGNLRCESLGEVLRIGATCFVDYSSLTTALSARGADV